MSTAASPAVSWKTTLREHRFVSETCDINRLLAEVKHLAAQLTEDASDLVSYSRGLDSWESLSEQVGRINEHIDEAGRTFQRIAEIRLAASPLQASTIEHVSPLLNRIAGATARLIHAIDENPKRLFMGEYRELIEKNSDLASQFAALIGAFVDFGGYMQKRPGSGSHQ